MEHRSSGQIGQPAACMIENKPVLPQRRFLGRAIMAPPGMPEDANASAL
jgi:hypothetical protein